MAFFVFLLFVMTKWFKALLTLVFGAGVFLFWALAYPQMDRMLAKLYAQNNGNVMAGQYFLAWKQLEQMEDKK